MHSRLKRSFKRVTRKVTGNVKRTTQSVVKRSKRSVVSMKSKTKKYGKTIKKDIRKGGKFVRLAGKGKVKRASKVGNAEIKRIGQNVKKNPQAIVVLLTAGTAGLAVAAAEAAKQAAIAEVAKRNARLGVLASAISPGASFATNVRSVTGAAAGRAIVRRNPTAARVLAAYNPDKNIMDNFSRTVRSEVATATTGRILDIYGNRQKDKMKRRAGQINTIMPIQSQPDNSTLKSILPTRQISGVADPVTFITNIFSYFFSFFAPAERSSHNVIRR